MISLYLRMLLSKSLPRQATWFSGKEISNGIILGDNFFVMSFSNPFFCSNESDTENKEHYPLDCLVFFLKNLKLQHPLYVRGAMVRILVLCGWSLMLFVDPSIDWLICLIESIADWSVDWLILIVMNWLIDWLFGWLIDCWPGCLLICLNLWSVSVGFSFV